MDTSVYFIQCEETKAVKIGVSRDPHKRLAQLQTACPGKLTLIASAPGDERREAELHAHFSDRRLRGEWFSLTIEDAHRSLGCSLKPPRQQWADSGMAFPDLCFILSVAAGFPCVIVEAPRALGGGLPVYQVARGSVTDPGRGYHFNSDRLTNGDDCLFLSPLEAAAEYLAAWQAWLRVDGNPN